MAKRRSGPLACGALVQSQDYGRVDVCGLEAGHDTMINPTPHRGKYREMVWEDFRDAKGHKKKNIISMGNAFEEERLHGGKPITEIPRHRIA